jgi:hypothetical protein
MTGRSAEEAPPAGARPLERARPSVVPALVLLATVAYIVIYSAGLARSPIRSDGAGYFIYLPGVVVFGDPTLEAVARDCCAGRLPAHGISRWPETGRRLNQYPIGVAVLAAPAYIVAHVLTVWMGMPADGFSFLYEHAAGLCGVAAFGLGLAMLRRVLMRSYTPAIVAATLLLIGLGTNLIHYAAWDPLYSHAYSFALISTLLYVIPPWYDAPSTRRSLLLGAVAGLVVLVRHPNALFLLLVPLFGLQRRGEPARQPVVAAAARRRQAAVAVIAGFAVFAPQLLLYKAITGRWLVSAYRDQSFDFADPQIAGVLFSVTKGLFFWSPVLLLVGPGLLAMRGAASAWRTPVAVVLAAHTYVVASWWDWQFGSSYGHRAFTDALGLMALPMAAALQFAAARRRVAIVTGVLVSAAVALSLAQMLQTWLGVMPMDDVTWEQYKRLFLRFDR